jgi:hypothetical protein
MELLGCGVAGCACSLWGRRRGRHRCGLLRAVYERLLIGERECFAQNDWRSRSIASFDVRIVSGCLLVGSTVILWRLRSQSTMTMRTMKWSTKSCPSPAELQLVIQIGRLQQSKQQNWASSLLSRRAAVQYLSTLTINQCVFWTSASSILHRIKYNWIFSLFPLGSISIGADHFRRQNKPDVRSHQDCA